MKVYCSGISGAGATEHINKVVEYAHSRGEEIKVFNVGQEVARFAKECGFPITPTGVLDLGERTVHYLSGGAYKGIARQAQDYKHCIIDGHIHFRWRGAITDAITQEMVSWINPDAYITMMDLGRPILSRLAKDKEQWKYEVQKKNLTVDNILDWQIFEVKTAQEWAAFHKKPMYVLPSNDCPDSLYKIATQRNVEVAYVSFPISHIKKDEESKQKIDHFIAELRRFRDLAIISPRSIELPDDPSSIEDQHTVTQDLEWFVGKSTKRIFVYFPKKVYSMGVSNELIHAKQNCKEVWFTAPEEMRDPFTNAAIHQRFYAPEECLQKLVESGMQRE